MNAKQYFLSLSIKRKLAACFAFIFACVAGIVVTVLFSVNQVNGLMAGIVDQRVPTALASTRIVRNVNGSLANLRGYLLTGEENFIDGLFHNWEHIEHVKAELDELSKGWNDPTNVKQWQELKITLSEFQSVQTTVQDIAHTAEEQPALKILIEDATPRTHIMIKEITAMIDEEIGLGAELERKALLGMMADIRATTAISFASIKAFLLTGDEKYAVEFIQNWEKNERRHDDLYARAHFLTWSQLESFGRFNSARTDYFEVSARMFEIRRSDKWNMANYILLTEVVPRANMIANILTGLDNDETHQTGGWVGKQSKLLEMSGAAASVNTSRLTTLLWVYLVLGAIMSVIIVFALTNALSKPITAVTNVMGYLAKGDHSVTIPETDRGDEIGSMAKALVIFQTELAEADRLRSEREQALANDLKAKDEFISITSHELRTPLTSIKGAISLMLSGVIDEDKHQQMLVIANNNSERLLRLINDLLDTQKLEAGKVSFQKETTDIAKLIQDAVEAHQGYADEYGVSYSCFGTDGALLVHGDKDRLMQVMANLLSNAAKFSQPGGQIEVSLARLGDDISISVKDYGSGIPEEVKDAVFEKFVQADSSDNRQNGGTGLGLAISKMIVEEHEGVIGFTTQVGKGSTFYVNLPEIRVCNEMSPVKELDVISA